MLNTHTFIPLLTLLFSQLLLHIHLWEIIDREVEIHYRVEFLTSVDEIEGGVVWLEGLEVCEACQLVACLS